MEQIEEMCKPLLQYLKETCDPYTEICISVDGVKVKQTVLGLPEEKAAGEEPTA